MVPKTAWKNCPVGSSDSRRMEKLNLGTFILYLYFTPNGAVLEVDPFGTFNLTSLDAVHARNEAIGVFRTLIEKLISEAEKSCAIAVASKIKLRDPELSPSGFNLQLRAD